VPVTVITQATPTARVGEPFGDTALVQGSNIPTGAELVFRAYVPEPASESPVCESVFFESARIPVTQAGVYYSGDTTADQAGNVYWIETLYDRDGDVIAEGSCGAPGETTVITEQPEELNVRTKAVAEVTLGQPAYDVAIVTGTVPEGTTLTFEAYRQDGDTATCTAAELVFTNESIALDSPGEYASSEVVFEEAGTYYWIETLHDSEGTVIHRGLCGAPDETTVVHEVPPTPTPTPTPTPEIPEKPDTPPSLAVTGGGDWWLPLGIGGGVFALAGALTLWFGRRLAIHRERTGYVREEDQHFLDLISEE